MPLFPLAIVCDMIWRTWAGLDWLESGQLTSVSLLVIIKLFSLSKDAESARSETIAPAINSLPRHDATLECL